MFTGIVEDTGKVVYIRRNKICVDTQLTGMINGDSLMVDGVCLTITDILSRNRYVMDIGVETLLKTALGKLGSGSYVNLERAMSLSSRINGHIVYGHIMAVGKINSKKISANTMIITIRADKDFLDKLILKGSVAVNGVSLTVNEIGKHFFKVGVVPETVKRTSLGKLTSSSRVNLEADMMVMK
jgi:riboflavin synthase